MTIRLRLAALAAVTNILLLFSLYAFNRQNSNMEKIGKELNILREAEGDSPPSQVLPDDSFESENSAPGGNIRRMESELKRMKNNQSLIMNSVIGFVVLISVVFNFLIIRFIMKKSDRLHKDADALSGGDLTVGVDSNGKDEFGGLGTQMTQFIEVLNTAFLALKEGLRLQSASRNDLAAAIEASAVSINQGEKDIDSIFDLTLSLDQSVRDSADSIDTIVGRIENFTEMIQSQVAMVEQSTAAMTQISASLSNMSKVVADNRDAAGKLEAASRSGSEKVEETGGIIKKVSGHVNAIQEMSDVIKGVADQTNLLAMNAAIEAAHAGDAGRGFGVVADEIRKLAETTAENSRIISDNLHAIIEDIKQAGNSSLDTVASFEMIDKEVGGVTNSLSEIASNIDELSLGGNQVLEAMNDLREYTSQVHDNTAEISKSIHFVGSAVNTASDISRRVSSGGEKIRLGMDVLRESSVRTGNVADTIKTVGFKLEETVNKFQTDARGRISEHTEKNDAESKRRMNGGTLSSSMRSERPAADNFDSKKPSAGFNASESKTTAGTADKRHEPSVRGRSVKKEDSERSVPGDAASKTAHADTAPKPATKKAVSENPKTVSAKENLSVPLFMPEESEPPTLSIPKRGIGIVEETDDGVTLSEGDWPGRREIVVVDDDGNTDQP